MRKRSGSALILMLAVVTLLLILGSSLLTVSLSTYKSKVASDSVSKLNLMAESGAEVALAQVKKSTSSSSLVDISGLKSDDGSITCNVKFKIGYMYDSSTNTYVATANKDTIESIASNATGYRTVRVSVTETPAAVEGIIPTDNLFFINGDVLKDKFSSGLTKGNVYINGSFYMSSSTSIVGKLISTGNMMLTGGCSVANGIVCSGDITLDGGSSVTNKIICFGNISMTGGSLTTDGVVSFGNVNLNGGGTINGDALIKGDLIFNPNSGPNINGNVISDGNLSMPQGHIQNNATIGKNVTFNGGTPKIGGKLYCYGNVTSTQQGSTPANFVPSGITKTITYTPVDLSSYASNKPVAISSNTLPPIAAPTSDQNAQLHNIATLNTVTSNSYTITDSGSLSLDLFNIVPWNSTLTIDTTNKDISLLINSDFKFDKQLKVEVTGPHNLYIYLTGKSSFTVDNQFVGMQNHISNSQIFIIGDDNQTVKLMSCELDAYIYIPNGIFSASGGHNPYMFQGSCVIGSVDIQNTISVNYLKPIIIGTPLAILAQPGSVTWAVDKWYK